MEDEEVVELIAEQIHETWSRIMNWIVETGEFNTETKELTIKNYMLSKWLHQMSKQYSSLAKYEQRSDKDNAQDLIKLLKEHGYEIKKITVDK